METLFHRPNSLKPGFPLLVDSHNSTNGLLSQKKKVVFCQSNWNEAASNGLSSTATGRPALPALAANSRSMAQMNAGGSLLSLKGKIHEEIEAKELISCERSLMEFHQGIGVVPFLRGKKFLVTGATGFLAKVLIEKILRTVPDVSKIYLIIKAKNKEAAIERLQNEIIQTELFKSLEETHTSSYQSFMLSKLVPVVGDVREDNLGIEAKVANEIAREVDIIVNSAANTTFDERYDVALDINTQGPSRLLSLAKRCKKLKLFLHVSTAYVNGQRQGRIFERPFCIGESIASERLTSETTLKFLPHLDVESEINLAKASQDKASAQKMKELGLERARIYGWQDTYTFTKAMGEMLIENMRGDTPVVIIRPSVIESTIKEPFPGWMEGNRMMDPIILYYGKGQLTGFLVDPKGVLDVVPADMVVNALLGAMTEHGAVGKPGMNVYHIASSVTNPLVFRDLARVLFEHFTAYPCMDSKGRPIHVQHMKLFHSMDEFSSHILSELIQRSEQAAVAGLPEKLYQRLENIYRKSVERVRHLANIYQPYTFYGGRFDNTNTQKLMDQMSEEEKLTFGFDVGSIDWKDYISNIHIPGLRNHVMKGRGIDIKPKRS